MGLSLHYQHIYWTLKRSFGGSPALGSSSRRTGLGQEAHGTAEKGGEERRGRGEGEGGGKYEGTECSRRRKTEREREMKEIS